MITKIHEFKLLLEKKVRYPALRTPLPTEADTYRVRAYHSTNLDYWPSIQRYGLIPGKADAPGQDWKAKWSGKATYLHLSFPEHEIDNGYEKDSGNPYLLVIEMEFSNHPQYFVPDEDVNQDVNYTPTAIANKEAIAVGYIIPTTSFTKIHMIDTPQAREWAKANVKRLPVEFHQPNNN